MNAPRVSVLLPVYNGAKTLQASLDSVLRQEFDEFELLAIDDGSTDDTMAMLRACRDPRLRVLQNERNLGLTRTLNRGLSEARGNLIARQDADDLSGSERLARQVRYLDEQPDVALVGSSSWRIDNHGRVLGTIDLPTTHLAIRWGSLFDNPFIHTSVLFRREVVRELGGYDEQWSICQDYELWNRIAGRCRVGNLRERLVFYRENPTSMMQSEPEAASAEMGRLLAINLASVLPGCSFTKDEIELLSLFRLRFPVERLVPLLALIERLRGEFLRRHPAAAGGDFAATVCRQQLRLAYKFLGHARTIAVRRMVAALICSPSEWLRQATVAIRCAVGSTPPLPA
jgi:cellulose synthase/poly-beta-1,6-N-acetylglucosamine synthase-like glycosyltransferase